MIKKHFYILKLEKASYLVIATSWLRAGYYLKDIINELNFLDDIDDVYFDFLMKNGLKDRFYKADFNKVELKFKSFVQIEVDKKIESIANAFFSQHLDLLKDSPLTAAQKYLFKKSIGSRVSIRPNTY